MCSISPMLPLNEFIKRFANRGMSACTYERKLKYKLKKKQQTKKPGSVSI